MKNELKHNFEKIMDKLNEEHSRLENNITSSIELNQSQDTNMWIYKLDTLKSVKLMVRQQMNKMEVK